MDAQSETVDLTTARLVDLQRVPEGDLADSLRRILEQLESGTEPVAGFQSAV